ncbi:MAG: hypothetical protein WED05_08985 [Candidatus Atabeyarchaeum deiterrae]
MPVDPIKFKTSVVQLILDGRPENALELLADYYHVSVPRIKVGLPKGHRKNVLGCYTARDRTISVLNSDVLMNPFVVLHEFYHHLRTRVDKVHRGTEGNAMEFAKSFVESYKPITTGS